MALYEEERLIIRENPLDSDHYEVVWKRRDPPATNDHRSRQKTATVENKLKSYDEQMNDGKKLKDEAIDYSFIDEYCKISNAESPKDEESRPRKLKTNTTEFGRPKESFDKFVRHHIGGGGVECTSTTQPLATGRRTSCERVQGNASYNRSGDHHEATPLRDCYTYGEDEVTLRCCGHDVETLVDYCTCMFCVKGVFYHCLDDSSRSDDVLNNPCSCSPINMSCVGRWSMLGLLSVLLPCLMCYPLARGGTGVCKCYKEGESRRKNRQNRNVQNRERERPT